MASGVDSSDYRERKEREPANSPSVLSGVPRSEVGINRESSRNVRMSNIESSVTKLLVATKQLIETLTGWSRRHASETDVSDVYVRLGNEFNIARTCFERAGIDMTCLTPPVKVLEACLARDASPRILEIYLPKVREIVINLLQGLKRKQARYRARANDFEEDQRSGSRQVPLESDGPKTPVTERRRDSPARRPIGGREESTDQTVQREISKFHQGSPAPSNPQPIMETYPPSSTEQQPTKRPSNDALQRLQVSDALQRRASKRFSAYNFAKLDGMDPENAGRTPPVPARRSGSHTPEISRRSQDKSHWPTKSSERVPQRLGDNQLGESNQGIPCQGSFTIDLHRSSSDPHNLPSVNSQASPEKIPIFLQLGSSIRKSFVSVTDFTLQSLRLLFVEKFQFNPGAETFPDILVTDRENGARYILEDGLLEIVEGTTFTLDIDGTSFRATLTFLVDSALKKTVHEGMNALLKEVSALQQTIASQQEMLSQLNEQHTLLREELTTHRQETMQKFDGLSSNPSNPSPRKLNIQPQLGILHSLKRELVGIKSEHEAFKSAADATISQLKNLPYATTVQVLTHDDLANQRSNLESKTQTLVTLSDDLSDQVDDLRIDITQKRIRPHPRAIANVRKNQSNVQASLVAAESLLRQLKPLWKKRWGDELQQVIDGQEFLRHQETLVSDLRKDLSDTETVITQIIQAAELFDSRSPREWMSGAVGSGGRDAVLEEVKTLQPNSTERLEAIRRAEKARLRELELRRENDFQLELEEVVTEKKLKMLGEGALRVEKEREEKDQKLRQQLWEGKQDVGKDVVNDGNIGTQIISGEKPVKRTVSEGSRSWAAVVENDDGVVRSQSHSSTFSRIKRVSSSAKRGSIAVLPNMLNADMAETEEEGEP